MPNTRDALEQFFTYDTVEVIDTVQCPEEIPEEGLEITLQISGNGELDGIFIE